MLQLYISAILVASNVFLGVHLFGLKIKGMRASCVGHLCTYLFSKGHFFSYQKSLACKSFRVNEYFIYNHQVLEVWLFAKEKNYKHVKGTSFKKGSMCGTFLKNRTTDPLS